MRIANESITTLAAPTAAPEPPKGRKGLPFLKNPMSTLLMRRRTAQDSPDSRPPAPGSQIDPPAYDPRIRGTRFHDFGAPRPSKVSPGKVNTVGEGFTGGSTTTLGSSSDLDKSQILPGSIDGVESAPYTGRHDGTKNPRMESLRDEVVDLGPSRLPDMASNQSDPTQADSRRLSLNKRLPQEPRPPASTASSFHTSASITSSTSSRQASILPKSTPSARTINSRNVSLSRVPNRESTISAIPKHMKSTSSRFSFDMIGAAKQEKLLEERHRQRELEKKTTDVVVDHQRDSRFDDFDDDGFDYDAMMEDDGLEERIPGVNADAEDDEPYEEEPYGEQYEEKYEEKYEEQHEERHEERHEAEMDPDDDQENFAGFVFERSNPQSSLTSPLTPGMLPTPRDANGKVIGFAMTKDTTPDLAPSASPLFLSSQDLHSKLDKAISGLGIQGLDIEARGDDGAAAPQPGQQLQTVDAPRAATKYDDDLYFDEGLAGELTLEYDGTAFDESIFDMNDTDAYGRPIPGAFAQGQSLRAAQAEAAKRESETTSRLSAQSAVSPSTAHTSLSVGLQPLVPPPRLEDQEEDSEPAQHGIGQPQPVIPVTGQDMAYQAALAEAAQKAAASGKFRRGSSPTPPADVLVTSPTDSSESHSHPENPLDGYEDDDFSPNLDDFDFDDEAIIAEANASALANDLDGFYGQEFGFYLAPINQSQNNHVHLPPSSSSSTTSSPPKSLSAENLYQYANGGYFGPAGSLNRSTSGRIVCREPNLTPITERSEYSNRNSIMSLALPSGVVGSGGGSTGPIQSPGLAQLAMMADDDNMSLSALLRLRSKAWGGSQASLVSSREGSPMSDRGAGLPGEGGSSPLGSGLQGVGSGPGHGRKNSSFSLWSNSDTASCSVSPTLTMSMPPPLPSSPPPQIPAIPLGVMGGPSPLFSPPGQAHRAPSPTAPGGSCPPVLEAEETTSAEYVSPTATGQTSLAGSGLWMKTGAVSGERERELAMSPSSPAVTSPQVQQVRTSGMGHRHKGSADSISYTKEEESGSGETRWVMERRRTAETGEVEILEREVVEGGRI